MNNAPLSFCKPTIIRMREIFVRFATALLSQMLPAKNQLVLMINVLCIHMDVDNAWS